MHVCVCSVAMPSPAFLSQNAPLEFSFGSKMSVAPGQRLLSLGEGAV